MTDKAEHTCSNCHFARNAGTELRCWHGPPQPCVVGMQSAVLAGQTPKPIVIGVVPPTWPDYFCFYWKARRPDHPDLVAPAELPSPTHEEPERPQ